VVVSGAASTTFALRGTWTPRSGPPEVLTGAGSMDLYDVLYSGLAVMAPSTAGQWRASTGSLLSVTDALDGRITAQTDDWTTWTPVWLRGESHHGEDADERAFTKQF
jgi:hypothetical protein